MNGTEFAVALRRMANWYESHPDVPVPAIRDLSVFLDSREEFIRVARLIGSAQKVMSGPWAWLTKDFDGVGLEFTIRRNEVCERRVVGTRLVPAIEAHEEEIVEWDCQPLLDANGT